MQAVLMSDLYANSKKRSYLYFLVALLTNPGFCTVLIYRIACAFSGKGSALKIVSLIFWRLNILLFSCHLHPKSKAGPGLALPHPTGVIFGEGTVIGANVTVYQGVTFGTNGGEQPAYPVVEDGVTVYPNSVIVGNVHIGEGAIIGACSFVNRDVQQRTAVAGTPARPLTRDCG